MKTRIPVMIVLLGLSVAISVRAQDGVPKVAILNIQMAISQSTDGQEAAKAIQTKFAPKRTELEKQQKEIADLQEQLNNQTKTLSDEARARLQRQIDDRTKAFNRNNEDATAEFQEAEADAINEIGRKMMAIISDYAKKNSYAMVLDISSPQTPVLYADSGIDITAKIIELYNQSAAKPAAATPTSGAAPTVAPKPPAPAAPAAPASSQPAAPARP